MLEALWAGLTSLFQPMTLGYIVAGTAIGLIIGVIPTIGGVLALALLLPMVVLGLPPEIGFGFLVALVAVTETGGSITSILLNIPGTGLNVATVLDGFPMTQKGQASRAIGAALTSSVGGGVLAAIIAIFMVWAIFPIVMSFRLGEITVLVIFGLSLLATLTGESVIKGLLSGIFGMFLSIIGMDLETGVDRFSFGTTYLYDGLKLIIMTIGLFGLGTIFDIVLHGRKAMAAGTSRTSFKDLIPGILDVWRRKLLFLRSSIIGYAVGLIPGVGGSVAVYTAYGYAKQTSKTPEEFGKGSVEGVIAPESANNAKESGSLLTTMVLGIPGSPTGAILMAGFLAVGIVPGPVMLRENLPMVFALLWGIGLANIIGVAMCFAATPLLAKIAYTPIFYVAPAVIAIIFLGSYNTAPSLWSILATISFGLLGLIMVRLGYSRAAFTLGFVLGAIFEYNLVLAIQLQGPFFWLSPINIGLILIMVFTFAWPPISRSIRRRKGVETR